MIISHGVRFQSICRWVKFLRNLSALGLLTATSTIGAQNLGFLELKTGNEWQSFVGAGKNAYRVGGAVLTHVHSHLPRTRATLTQKILLDCQGRWAARIRAFHHFSSEGAFTAESQESYAQRQEKIMNDLSESITMTPLEDTSVFYAASLRAYARTICESAQAEPRKILIPLPSDPLDAQGVGRAYAISELTAVSGNEVTYWSTGQDFTLEPRLSPSGAPLLDKAGGIEKYRKALGKGYTQFQTRINCKERQSALLQIKNYTPSGQLINTTAGPFLPMRPVRPGSNSEKTLSLVCAIYVE